MSTGVIILIVFIMLVVIAGIIVGLVFWYRSTRKKDNGNGNGNGNGGVPIRLQPGNVPGLVGVFHSIRVPSANLYLTDSGITGETDLVGTRTPTNVTCNFFRWEYSGPTTNNIPNTLKATWKTAPNQFMAAQFTNGTTPTNGDQVALRSANITTSPPGRTQWIFVPQSVSGMTGRWCLQNFPSFCLVHSGTNGAPLTIRDTSQNPNDSSVIFENTAPIASSTCVVSPGGNGNGLIPTVPVVPPCIIPRVNFMGAFQFPPTNNNIILRLSWGLIPNLPANTTYQVELSNNNFSTVLNTRTLTSSDFNCFPNNNPPACVAGNVLGSTFTPPYTTAIPGILAIIKVIEPLCGTGAASNIQIVVVCCYCL